MDKKTNWRTFVLEDGLIFIMLMGVGVTVAAIKLMPIVLRWSKGGR